MTLITYFAYIFSITLFPAMKIYRANALKIDKFHSVHDGLRFGDGLLIPLTIGSR